VGNAWAKIELPTCASDARIVRIAGGMKRTDVTKAREIVRKESILLWDGWRRFHG
jgi:hypothetical protein